MVENVKLSSRNDRWHLTTVNVAKAENISSTPRISPDVFNLGGFCFLAAFFNFGL